MPPSIVHSLSTSVAGFVIAAYWLMYVVVIGFEAAFPATLIMAPREAAQICERDTSHNEVARDLIGSCGPVETGEAAAEVETPENGTL